MTRDADHPDAADGRRAWRSLWPWLSVAVVVLAACGGPVAPGRLTLERAEREAGSSFYSLYGASIRGDAEVRVCGQLVVLPVVLDESGVIIADTSRDGVRVRFRLPDLGPTDRVCDIEVMQTARRGSANERARLIGAIAYSVPTSPLTGAKLLLYASIGAFDTEKTPRAWFANAVSEFVEKEDIDLTVVHGTATEYSTGALAVEFASLLEAEAWDVIVFIEEIWTLPTTALNAISQAVARGDARALGSYWLTFVDDAEAGGAARAFAAAFDVAVTPDDNVVPVEGGSIDIAFAPPLDDGLANGRFTLQNVGFYFLSYAQRLSPLNGATSLCAYQDAEGGSCAVANATETSLYLGFTLAPLSESMTGAELETLFVNALTLVVTE